MARLARRGHRGAGLAFPWRLAAGW